MSSRDTRKAKERKIFRKKLLELLIGDAPVPQDVLKELSEEEIISLLRERKNNLDIEKEIDSIEDKLKDSKAEIRKSVKKASEKDDSSIDDLAKTHAAIKRAFQKAYDQQAASLYSQQDGSSCYQAYSYMKNVRQQTYGAGGGFSVGAIELDIQHEDDFFNPKFDESLKREVIRAKKIKDVYGVEVYVSPIKKSLFEAWNSGHKLDNQVLYSMINI